MSMQRMTTSTGYGEWADRILSIARGCSWDGYGPSDGVGCLYCWARCNARRWGWKRIDTDEEWVQHDVNWAEVNKARGSIPGVTAYPGTHDISLDLLGPSIVLLEHLLANDNQVLLVTKPRLACVQAICDRFADHPYQRNIAWRFTITSNLDYDLSYWEPNAPPFIERLSALCYAAAAGYRVSVNTEPLTCNRQVAGILAEQMLHHLSGLPSWATIWLGRMNQPERRVVRDTENRLPALMAEWDIDGVRWLYDRFRDEPRVRWKNSFKDVLGLPRNERPGMDV